MISELNPGIILIVGALLIPILVGCRAQHLHACAPGCGVCPRAWPCRWANSDRSSYSTSR